MKQSSFVLGKNMGLAILLILSILVPVAMAAGVGGNEPPTWELKVIDDSAYYSIHPSLVLGKNGVAHISYSDGTGRIRHAEMKDGRWAVETAASTWGTMTSAMALDALGNPAIAYGDGMSYGNLMYANSSGRGWRQEFVDNGCFLLGNVGHMSSLAFDSKGAPHIVYNNGNHFAILQYATRKEAAWDTMVIDGGLVILGDTGYDPALVMDHLDEPIIAYRDGKHYASLRIARRNISGTWEITEVDNGGWFADTGYMPSLALDMSGNPHISYYDKDNKALRYASWDGTQWILECVDSKGNVGKYSSLVIDSHNQPYISYYDETNYSLRFATMDPATRKWLYWTVDSEKVGLGTSLALDPLGHPSIAYYDLENHAMKYAGWTGLG